MEVFTQRHQKRKEMSYLLQTQSDESHIVITSWFNRTIMYGLF